MRTNDKTQQRLLIGSPAGVFVGGPVAMHLCKNIYEGITAARQSAWDTVYVVFSQLPNPKMQALEALHQVCPQTPLCLLIRMHEEPLALEMYRSCAWAKSVLDYQICPLNPASLDPPAAPVSPGGFETGPVQQDKDRRIQELAALVMQDDMTGLKNRRYLRQFLPAILKKAEAARCRVTLLLFDIDDFKHYNDTYGHLVGDDVLRQTAKLIRCCCREQDVVARLGGDEFAVVFWDVPEDTQAQKAQRAPERRRTCQDHPRQALFMAERFRNEMSTTSFDLLGPKGKGSLTISGGLATFPSDANTAEELFEKADQAMLEAKRSGKNRIQLVGSGSEPRIDTNIHE